EDQDGCVGWGETWCNYPAVAAEHRVRVLISLVAPLAAELALLDQPAILWTQLASRLAVLAIQTGEYGPIAQTIAGLECAAHDLAARRAGAPLHRYLDQRANGRVAVYASGINPDGAPETAAAAMARGFAGCKIKVGFGAEIDAANLRGARAQIGADAALMADANQGWSFDQALAFLPVCDDVGLAWLEEPLRHDAPDAQWRSLAENTRVAIAAGENFSSVEDFETLPSRRHIKILQPDLGKWGGAALSLAIARASAHKGLVYCPHWLGSGVGLLASMHVKAASRTQSGYVEVDVNPNPMRQRIVEHIVGAPVDGAVTLPDTPGIGDIGPLVAEFSDALVMSEEASF
ncbi:MAG: mandelate racemase/muconate lactonizing enzyme family protein, partial [Hyphomicrobiales bacterium]|nr:mandelate racemase/muconate lactonizing enzyme family protein [Hyphomicrobiales bacterium]